MSALEDSGSSGTDRDGGDFGDSDDEDEQFVGVKEEADEDGEVDGAKIYEENGGDDVFAIKDDVLVVASTRSQLEDALEQRCWRPIPTRPMRARWSR